jgi:hypothetical protein
MTMHIKLWQYDNMTTALQGLNILHPGGIWTRDLMFWTRARWPLCQAARPTSKTKAECTYIHMYVWYFRKSSTNSSSTDISSTDTSSNGRKQTFRRPTFCRTFTTSNPSLSNDSLSNTNYVELSLCQTLKTSNPDNDLHEIQFYIFTVVENVLNS